MAYRHPGKAFLLNHQQVNDQDDILEYASFLRAEAGVLPHAPLDLQRIFETFEMPAPKTAALPNQQGLLLLPEAGLMVINENDTPSRQRFTQAHELMELLFDALPDGRNLASRRKGGFIMHAKEKLCDLGAAHLLMPAPVFRFNDMRHGLTFETARRLAESFRVSTTAALVQMVRQSPGRHAAILWAKGLKKSEQKHHDGQLPLFGDAFEIGPVKKLRVAWAFGSPEMPMVPRNKSAGEQNAVHDAYETGLFSAGDGALDLGTIYGPCRIEAWPFDSPGERRVLSLIEFSG